MLPQDSFDQDHTYIECRKCGHREITADRSVVCPVCAAESIRNLAVPRE